MMKISHKHPWTYKIILHYHRCPNCGYIMESREDFQERFGKHYKDLDCFRCKHHFTLTKSMPVQFGPLLKTDY